LSQNFVAIKLADPENQTLEPKIASLSLTRGS